MDDTLFTAQQSTGNRVEVRPSQLARAILMLKGKPLDMDGYKPFEMIYDIMPKKMVAQCGRQLGKSAYCSAAITTNSILRPHFKTLFISPLAQQTSRFSSQYLEPYLNSPIIRKHYIDSSSKKNVFERSLNNGSAIILGYAETEQDADRIRGVSADFLLMDEFQDCEISIDSVLSETLSASDYGFKRYTGTAKGESNSLAVTFKKSNMMEWVVKCPHCGKYNIPNTFENCLAILNNNPDGPACIRCGKLLSMHEGQWLAAKPTQTDLIGVHVPQVCVPARNRPEKWKELKEKARDYSSVTLANEVFGLPVGAGGRPLSMREVMACCNPDRQAFDIKFPRDGRNIVTTVLGVDWSVTGSDKSYTVITVIGYDYVGKAYLLYSQRLDGIDILEQVRRVIDVYNQFDCSMIGSDRGVGVLQGQLMKEALGDDRVAMINYVAAKRALRWDKEGLFYAADRTMNMDTMILKAKLGRAKFETPCWDLMSNFWQDALNIFEEETQSGRRVFRKEGDQTDDWLHSIVFANVAYMVVRGQFSFVEKDAVDSDTFDF